MRWLEVITDAMDMNLGKLQEMVRAGRPGVLQSKGSQGVKHDLATEQQQRQQSNFSHQRFTNFLSEHDVLIWGF